MVEIRLQLESRSTYERLGRELGQRDQDWEEVKAFPFRGTAQVLKHRGEKLLEPVESIGLPDEPVDGRGVPLLQDIGEEFMECRGFPRDVEQCCFSTPREIEVLIPVQALFIVLGDECDEGHSMPLLTRTVSADNNGGDGADGSPRERRPHTPASDRSLGPEH